MAAEFHLVVQSAGSYRCGEGGIPHVWETLTIPPHSAILCLCGEMTWKEGVALARRRWEDRQVQRAGTLVLPP